MNRLGLKISCLAVAVTIWLQVASTSVVEQDISLPLRVTGLQTGLTITGSELPREIPVRVKLRTPSFSKASRARSISPRAWCRRPIRNRTVAAPYRSFLFDQWSRAAR